MIWGTFFHVNKKEFTMKKYRFNNMIDTDGVSASLLFIRSDLYVNQSSTLMTSREAK